MTEIIVRDAVEKDLEWISNIHIKAFPNSALSKLGAESVKRYYEWQLVGPHECLSLVALLDEKIVAFCFSGVFKSALGGFLQKNRNFLIVRVFFHPWLLFNEIFREKIFEALRSLKVLPKKKQDTDQLPKKKMRSYGILSIAVDPDVQTKGIGRLLMEKAENNAIEKRFEQMHLSVNSDNLQAINFYLGLGWVKKGDPWTGSMIKNLVKNQ